MDDDEQHQSQPEQTEGTAAKPEPHAPEPESRPHLDTSSPRAPAPHGAFGEGVDVDKVAERVERAEATGKQDINRTRAGRRIL